MEIVLMRIRLRDTVLIGSWTPSPGRVITIDNDGLRRASEPPQEQSKSYRRFRCFFANNGDLSTQLGHMFFIGDDIGSFIPISFKSYKTK